MAEQFSAEKPSLSHSEDVEAGIKAGKRAADMRHGDTALALIGDERVVVTEEDVRSLYHTD